MAVAVREEIGLQAHDALDLRAFATHRGIHVVGADELVALDRLRELEGLQPFAFSACTFEIGDHQVIVLNPLRSLPRQNSDLGHELAHMLLAHELSEVHEIAGVSFRTCRADQEEEATNLAGALLLPRPLLLRAAGHGWTTEEIAATYAVSVDMARFRMNTTGVTRQLSRSARAAGGSR